ncbi:hypothetical protein CY34DRAFT_27153 [Suillus luteus UH-Slu-Lm8-n1]|uniref:DUF6589 domain-containing protein n=1 Tax=Suillus luteus UH-Slu-Lm8-n1 TaxID=930992 RepID=A0A0D0A3F2_9AGAM|nr:hypothetical protein CY34DRAFT_27153 [Suillus luteus UH-Slu-Lm8-n1]
MFKMLLALLDANPGRRRMFSIVDIEEMLQEYEEGGHEDGEMDLGDFGGDNRCNTLQCVFGIFLHSTGTPQRVIDVLAHAGVSISTQSIATAVKSLSNEAGVQIKQAVQTLTTALAYDNFDIDFKTAQPTIEHQSQFVSSTSATAIPLYGVDDPASTTDGNIEVMDTLLRQGGIGECEDAEFDPQYDVDMSAHVLLVHRDLLTKERLDVIVKSQCIEDTLKCRFQHVVFIPGLFHFKMACADVLWHTWIQPQFVSKPGFRQMHDVLHHDLWASILNCWLVEAQTRDSTWDSLEVFAKCTPSWELVVEMSECIINKFVANTMTLMHQYQQPTQEHDQQFENQVLHNCDKLLYVDLCHAMNSGDIGQVEASFLSWIYIFKATKKHKYAYHTARFMVQMQYAFKFRPVDWLVERNNLYTKVIFAGQGSNHTLKHIINESPLIELYWECHIMIENGFHFKNCTMKHAPPDMTKTLQKLHDEI